MVIIIGERRIVVTGMGIVSCLGNNIDTFFTNLAQGKSGIGEVTAFDTDGFESKVGGEVDIDFEEYGIGSREQRRTERANLLGIVAAEQAINDARIDFSQDGLDSKTAIIIGADTSGTQTLLDNYKLLEKRGPVRVSPLLTPKMMVNAIAGLISIRNGIHGFGYTVNSACASSNTAMCDAFDKIKLGKADVIITGGISANVNPITFAGFGQAKALSTHYNDDPKSASRPFDSKRDGFVLAEGAGILIFEEMKHAEARGVTGYAEVVNYGGSSDANAIVAPDENGLGAYRAMQLALQNGEDGLYDLDYINTHGTATLLGDPAEVKAIQKLFGEYDKPIYVSSTKSMHGHGIGAAGGIEAIASIGAIMTGVIPPTINLSEIDPECRFQEGRPFFHVAQEARKHNVEYALSNSFGFGGHNFSILFRKIN
jgi:3-oxoacyl-[acyl-carrier-protein] synthase II